MALTWEVKDSTLYLPSPTTENTQGNTQRRGSTQGHLYPSGGPLLPQKAREEKLLITQGSTNVSLSSWAAWQGHQASILAISRLFRWASFRTIQCTAAAWPGKGFLSLTFQRLRVRQTATEQNPCREKGLLLPHLSRSKSGENRFPQHSLQWCTGSR